MANWKERLSSWKESLAERVAEWRVKMGPHVEKLSARASDFAERMKLRERMQRLLPQDLAKSLPKSWDWRAILEWMGAAVQKRGAAFYGTLLTLVLSAFFLADLAALWIESRLPDTTTAEAGRGGSFRQPLLPKEDDYAVIWGRNLFNSKGLIPGDATPASGQGIDLGGTPQPTSLPLNLVGTLILRDELKSIATIEDKSASMVFPVRVEDEIPSKIRILKIEPSRVTFLNIGSGRREYVEIPEDAATNKVSISRPSGGKSTAIERTGNSFNVPRLELDRAFTDLNSVLTQARAVPHYENGVPAGYKLFQVMPEGFFGKLGLKDQDVICGIDGQSVNDPAKALELLGSLKTANHVELCVKRDGRQQNFAYDIR